MINLKIRKCLSEAIRVTKSFAADADIDLQGDFKTAENVLSPVIQVQSDADLSQYNYCEIPEFGRMYFMTARADSAHMWTLTLKVDSLSSFAAGIRNSEAIVKRSQNKINYYINDGVFFTEQRQLITYHNFKRDGIDAKLRNTDSYYLLVAGG